jgi:hypothetical protein
MAKPMEITQEQLWAALVPAYKWVARDKDGDIYAYIGRPEKYDGSHWAGPGFELLWAKSLLEIKIIGMSDDWAKSLIERPNPEESDNEAD